MIDADSPRADQCHLRADSDRCGPRPAPRGPSRGASTRHLASACSSKGRRAVSAKQLGNSAEWASRCEDSATWGTTTRPSALAVRLEQLLPQCSSKFDDKDHAARLLRRRQPFWRMRSRAGRRITIARDKRPNVFGLDRRRRGVSLALRFARHRPSTGDRPVQVAAGKVRRVGHSAAGPTASWSTHRSARRGRRLPGRHGTGRKLRDGQPSADQRAGARSVSGGPARPTGQLVYFISHNIARKEIVDNRLAWVHRKGATRAFPGGHHALQATRRSPRPAIRSCCRAIPKQARRDGGRAGRRGELLQRQPRRGPTAGSQGGEARTRSTEVDRSFDEADILTNCRSIRSTKPRRPTRISTKSSVGEVGRPGKRSRAAEGHVCDQGWR